MGAGLALLLRTLPALVAAFGLLYGLALQRERSLAPAFVGLFLAAYGYWLLERA